MAAWPGRLAARGPKDAGGGVSALRALYTDNGGLSFPQGNLSGMPKTML